MVSARRRESRTLFAVPFPATPVTCRNGRLRHRPPPPPGLGWFLWWRSRARPDDGIAGDRTALAPARRPGRNARNSRETGVPEAPRASGHPPHAPPVIRDPYVTEGNICI